MIKSQSCENCGTKYAIQICATSRISLYTKPDKIIRGLNEFLPFWISSSVVDLALLPTSYDI